MLGVIWFILWQIFGLILSLSLLKEYRFSVKLWIGSAIGSLLSAWSPVPWSFIFGFTYQSHVFALAAGFFTVFLSVYFSRRKETVKVPATAFHKSDITGIVLVLPLYVLCLVILFNHTIVSSDGGLYTGQCTYGDMPMHLGFITSIAGQGTFPPYYSILPSSQLCYPFLCDSISASLYLLGLNLRWSYMLPSCFAILQVLWGGWTIALELTGKEKAAALAFIFFFLNGGLGIIYYLNGTYTFTQLISGFYITPTNLTDVGIRWVNVIADMLIPQRATLYGWSILFPALFLLYRAVFLEDRKAPAVAGILGGLLPMIHTHSFFALGLTAICWMICSFIRKKFSRDWFRLWLSFGLTAVALAVPQLLIWTFHSVSGNSSFLRIGFDWVNGFQENWLWFWFKNVGPVFLITPAAWIFCLCKDRRRAALYSPVFLIFVLGEIVLFQPNPYDNNKIFYIAYLFASIMSAEAVCFVLSKAKSNFIRIAAIFFLLLLCTNAAVLTLVREVISGTSDYHYQLFSSNDVAAAEYIETNTEPDSVFLTADNHNNTVAVLTGRNIVCGSPSYVYYHGLDYTGALADEQAMLQDGEVFEALKGSYSIDYVYISRYEKTAGADIEYFDANYPVVYQNTEVTIYKISP